ncbi:unnamed protein product [Gongylonema pulchrum]|uniref:Uncharacterized protein n=1 Tax=Gongylonema pulchrum TaxID=637853 RepID=A0A183E8D7_9BILA|nr:unnamed protein product [Gongylonema pulchrum]
MFLGYSVFVVEGILPPCAADEQLSQCPVNPALAAFSDSYRDDQSQDPNIARAIAVSQICLVGIYGYAFSYSLSCS